MAAPRGHCSEGRGGKKIGGMDGERKENRVKKESREKRVENERKGKKRE
jgi:hypothetical protein